MAAFWFVLAAHAAGTAAAATLDEIALLHRQQVAAVAADLQQGIRAGDTQRVAELEKALDKARSLAVEATQGGTFVVRSLEGDFYYAWLMCRLKNDPASWSTGSRLLRKILQTDALGPEQHAKINEELHKCEQRAAAAGDSVQRATFQETGRLVISAVHKGGRGGSSPLRFLGEPKLKPLVSTQVAQLQSDFAALLGPVYRTIRAGRFIVAGRRTDLWLKTLHERVLDPYHRHLAGRLGIDDDAPIFVVVASEPREAVGLGARLLGSKGAVAADDFALDTVVAYSEPRSRVLVAVCGKDAANCTSFAHELFHLLNDRVYADAPWWLFEGMAELFESGEVTPQGFSPRVGWRKRDLDYDDLTSAGLERLLSLGKNSAYWHAWPGPEKEMAKARFFAQFLQERKMLWPVYYALRSRPSAEAAADPSGVATLRKMLGPMSQVAPEFQAWARSRVEPAAVAPGP